ncbi:amidohydrolase family protein [Saccharomonospora sp. NPDC046836]|uniref:amidohydrolase family protein n=1 Tax=Saccharomonospora sp. NPDC046836 TaxID=3156921 RepID=UPI0033FB10D8
MNVDADIHPNVSAADLLARLDEPWRSKFAAFGTRIAPPPLIYPRVRNGGMRVDSWPQDGLPGSDLELLRTQLLDKYDVDFGVLIPMQGHTFGAEETGYAAALCRALNDALRELFLDPEPRLRSSLCVPHESPEAAVAEIERLAGDERFVQVLFPVGTELPPGNAKYRPIYAAAARAGLPVAMHLGGIEGHRGDGWPSFYLEQHAWYGNATATAATSLVCSGVFEELPQLQVVLVEGGISWLAPLMWALDEAWALLRADTPALRRAPSEYLREHFWFTTQPIEEPEDPRHLTAALEHTGMTDRIVFSSDYPHWDFDSPAMALAALPAPLRQAIMTTNGQRLYGSRR